MHRVCIGIHVHAEAERLRATLSSVHANTTGAVELLLLPDGPDEGLAMPWRPCTTCRNRAPQNRSACPPALIAWRPPPMRVCWYCWKAVRWLGLPGWTICWLRWMPIHAGMALPVHRRTMPGTRKVFSHGAVAPSLKSRRRRERPHGGLDLRRVPWSPSTAWQTSATSYGVRWWRSSGCR